MSTKTKDIDVSSLPLIEQVRQVYGAYMLMVMGKQTVQIRYGNHWVQYRHTTPADVEQLRQFYMTLWNQLPCDQRASLPDLSLGKRVQRGPAVGGVFF